MNYISDPFNRANEPPKVHDSEVLNSFGRKNTISCALRLPNECTTEVAHIFIFPGLHSGLSLQGFATDFIAPVNSQIQSHLLWPSSVHSLSYYDSNGSSVDTFLEAESIKTNASKSLRQWRVVSQGLKLNVLNTADSNDGWFEAVRFKPDYNNLATITGLGNYVTTSDSFTGVIPKDNTDDFITKTTIDLCQMTTYQSGRLRELNDLVFLLQRDNDDCPWVTTSDSDFSALPFDRRQMNSELGRAFYDTNFDAIYIRIYGRKDPPPETVSFCRGTRMLLEVTSNLEMIFGPSNPMHMLMTKSFNRSAQIKALISRLQKYKTPGRTLRSLTSTSLNQ